MIAIISKARAVSAVIFAVAFFVIELVPLTLDFVKMMLRLLVVVSAMLYFVSIKKGELWNFLFWLWSAFVLPVAVIQFLLMGYIGQYVPVEMIATWGLPTYFMLLLATLWGVFKYFKRVMAEMQ